MGQKYGTVTGKYKQMAILYLHPVSIPFLNVKKKNITKNFRADLNCVETKTAEDLWDTEKEKSNQF